MVAGVHDSDRSGLLAGDAGGAGFGGGVCAERGGCEDVWGGCGGLWGEGAKAYDGVCDAVCCGRSGFGGLVEEMIGGVVEGLADARGF